MGANANSLDAMHAAWVTSGGFVRWIATAADLGAAGNPTAATINAGFMTWARYPSAFTMPSVGSGIKGLYLTVLKVTQEDVTVEHLTALEFTLGQITGNGGTGTVANLAAMPARHVGPPHNASITNPASIRLFARVTTALPAVAPVLTVTYTDQDGNTGNTANITLPASSTVDTCYDITPHLASGDTGAREVTALSWTGSPASGVVRIVGLLPLQSQDLISSGTFPSPPLFCVPMLPWCIEPGDVVGFYRGGQTGASSSFTVMLVGLPETT